MALVKSIGDMSGRPHGPYTVKKRRPGRRQPEQMRVAVRHQLVGALGRRVEAHRVVHALILRKGQHVIAP
jgi:hypothetical protein